MSAKAFSRLRKILTVVLVLAALYGAYRYTLHRMVEAEIDAIRKQGYPVTLAELNKWYPQPPPGQNAADVYLQAFKLLAPRQPADTNLPIVGDAKLPPRGQPMNQKLGQLVSDYLATNRQALTLLHEGARFRQCRYPIDLTRGGATLLPHLINVRQGVRLLCLEALVEAERGDADRAARSIACALALAQSLSEEPILLSQQVRLTCYWITAGQLEPVLNRVSPLDASLAEWERALAELHSQQKLVRGCAGERCSLIDFSMHPVKSVLDGMGSMPPPPHLRLTAFALRASGLFDVFLLRDLDAVKRFQTVCSMPFPDGVKQTKDADYPDMLTPASLINGLRLASERTFVQLVALDTARVTVAMTGVAVERYRVAKGNLPSRLDELVPEFLTVVPSDPFDGRPLRYKKLVKGYVVYSVGEDGKDDGGDEKKDITFTVEW
jgi:hypothetical protein